MNIPGLDLPPLPDAAPLTLSLGDVTLGGYLWTQTRPAPAALLLHGWGQDASDMAGPARLFHAAGWHALSLSLRGWRGSGGCDDYGRSGPGDVLRVLDWLRGQFPVTSILLLGLSLGGLIALRVGEREGAARAVVAVNPVTDLRRVYAATSSRILRRWYDAVLTPEQWEAGSPLTHARHLKAPALLVLGREDHICPPHLGRMYAREAGAQVLEVEGMGHEPDGAQWAFIVEQGLSRWGEGRG